MKNSKKNQGAVFINRSILNWQHYSEQNYLIVFLTLILTANHAPRWWHGISIKRGQTVISLESLASLCGLSKPTVTKILKRLEESGEINRRRIKKFNRLTTIINYDKYQQVTIDEDKKFNQQLYSNNNYSNNIYIEDNKYNKEPAQKIFESLLQSGIVIEQFCLNEGISVEQFKELGNDVLNEWKLTKPHHNSERDIRLHLLNHIRLKIKHRNLINASDELRLARFIDDCKKLIDEGFPTSAVRDFYSYWTQPCNDRSGRMLFESVKAFDVATRFKAYFNRKISK